MSCLPAPENMSRTPGVRRTRYTSLHCPATRHCTLPSLRTSVTSLESSLASEEGAGGRGRFEIGVEGTEVPCTKKIKTVIFHSIQ